ncbi:unnamed protein product [Lymnaea stagnalis]|uniref:15-hydroxyprostaglandin dehydrogenase [NAD(+)] n=1 Tax=Lymnaea stagnalis TaxID=6523 RepID=A0AAV2HZ11_LYMST
MNFTPSVLSFILTAEAEVYGIPTKKPKFHQQVQPSPSPWSPWKVSENIVTCENNIIMQLFNRVAFVTGAAQGLGKAFSEALLNRGAKVCFTDIQVSKGKEVEKTYSDKYGQDRVLFLHCDVSSSASLANSFKDAVSKFGHIDLMVNNAGIADESRLRDMVNINLIGAIEGSMLAVEHMRKDKGGKGGVVINIASTAGLTGVYFVPSYCASKFGLVGFHLSWASNPYNSQMGLQFGCLCPAFTDTDILNQKEKQMLYFEDGQRITKHLGINRVEKVVQGFLQMVESENCNGDIITITAKEDIQYSRRASSKMSHL